MALWVTLMYNTLNIPLDLKHSKSRQVHKRFRHLEEIKGADT